MSLEAKVICNLTSEEKLFFESLYVKDTHLNYKQE